MFSPAPVCGSSATTCSTAFGVGQSTSTDVWLPPKSLTMRQLYDSWLPGRCGIAGIVDFTWTLTILWTLWPGCRVTAGHVIVPAFSTGVVLLISVSVAPPRSAGSAYSKISERLSSIVYVPVVLPTFLTVRWYSSLSPGMTVLPLASLIDCETLRTLLVSRNSDLQSLSLYQIVGSFSHGDRM